MVVHQGCATDSLHLKLDPIMLAAEQIVQPSSGMRQATGQNPPEKEGLLQNLYRLRLLFSPPAEGSAC